LSIVVHIHPVWYINPRPLLKPDFHALDAQYATQGPKQDSKKTLALPGGALSVLGALTNFPVNYA